MDRSHLLKALKVLFPDKSSYRIRQGDIPLILYTYECYRRGIKEVRLTKYFLSNKYLKKGEKQIFRQNGKRILVQRKAPSLVYMAGYLKKKFALRSYVDILLAGLSIGMENPSRLVIASQRFQKNKRLSKLSAEEIKKEWLNLYNDADAISGTLKESDIKAIRSKKGVEWQNIFRRIDDNLRKISSLEITVGLSLYFSRKRIQKGNYKIDEEKTFLFDTLFQLLRYDALNPINIKRVHIRESFSPEEIAVVRYIKNKSRTEGIKPSTFLFYYVLSQPPPEVKKFFETIVKPFDKKKMIWRLVFVRDNLEKFNTHTELPIHVKEHLNSRILLIKS